MTHTAEAAPKKKKPKKKDIDVKYKQSEVTLFMKDFITLFILFNSENIYDINKENNKVEGMPIVQQHIQGVGNIYAPEIIIR